MSSLKDKMYNYEATPPAGSWDKIAAALNDEAFGEKYPGILHDMEVIPPTQVWNKINQSLQGVNPETTGSVTETPVKKMPIWRYAAAAAIIGAIAVAILNWGGNNGKTESLAVKNTTEEKANPNLVNESPADANQPLVLTDTEPATTEANLVSSKKIAANTERPSKSVNNSSASNNYTTANTALYTYDDHVPMIADRYVMLMTPDGSFIRMSKKWGNMICCVSGEEQDPDCKDQLKKWQEKLAQSSMDAGNFMDILDFVNSEGENNDL